MTNNIETLRPGFLISLKTSVRGNVKYDKRRATRSARSLPGAPRDQAQAIIIISPKGDVPAELAGHATVIDWPMPDRAET
jgi:hypothetical protein